MNIKLNFNKLDTENVFTDETKKNYVLDTNILLLDPNALFDFAENNVWITGTTLQELDSKKTLSGELGYNARCIIRTLDVLREKGNLEKGVPLDEQSKELGFFRIEADCIDENELKLGFSLESPDNRIIATVKKIMQKYPNTILVTNDISMRVNASICGVPVEPFKKNRVSSNTEEYTGVSEVNVEYSVITDLGEYGELEATRIEHECEENEFLILKSGVSSILAIYQKGTLKHIRIPKQAGIYGVTPKNASQQFALYALMAPVEEIPFVILKGEAGTAKTFLSLAAALQQIEDSKFDEVLITRNNVIAGNEDLGFLPGDIMEKMHPLLAPFFDNLKSLLRIKYKDVTNEDIQLKIDELFSKGLMNVCPLAYMRGRSITHSYLIVDEAQNSSRLQMRDIITRAGEGTKIIICGDPKQIDSPVLDKYNNGLAFAADKMKGSTLCAQITFGEKESVRSKLATEALKRLVV